MEEEYSEILAGFEPVTTILGVFIILVVTVLVAWVVSRLYNKFILNNTTVTNVNLTNYKFLRHFLTAVIYLIGISLAIWTIPSLQHIATSLVAGAGILTIVIGFASQQALGNIVSGVFIVMFKPYIINDRIAFKDGLSGIVEDINLRHTVIRNFENQRIIIPNAVISNEVLINSNFSDTRTCKFIEIGVSYTSDIDLAKKIMAEEVENHPLNIDVRERADIDSGVPRVTVRLLKLSDSSILLRAWAWAKTPPDGFVMQCDLLESIKKRFDAEGIVIPFPQRTVSYLQDAGHKMQGAGEISPPAGG